MSSIALFPGVRLRKLPTKLGKSTIRWPSNNLLLLYEGRDTKAEESDGAARFPR